MTRKIFKPIGVGGATALIAITSFLSYAIGLLRDRIIATNFGTTSATDTYNASFLIPDLLFNLFIAGALSAAFLPVFSELLTKDKKEAYKIANTMLTGASILIGVLALLAFIFMGKIIPFAFSTATPEMQIDIINLTRLILPSAILFAISNTLGNILMSYKHFVAYAISPILYNLGIILGILFLNKSMGIQSAAIGVLIGASLHCLIRIIDTLYTSYKYKPQLDVSHPSFKKILKLMLPKSLSLIAWQINLYIFAVVGIRLLEGSFAAFNYARNIQSFAVSLFGIAFATAVFPYLTTTISENDKEKYTSHIQKTMQRILFFTIPAMVGVMVLSDEIVEIILGGGVFDEKSVALTSGILFFFAISIPFESLVHILARGFYALKNTLTPMAINLTAMTIIALTTIYIAPKYGINWFSIGFTLGLVTQVVLLIVFLRKHLKNFAFKIFSISIIKTIIASMLMAIVLALSVGIESYISPNSTAGDFTFLKQISNLLRILIGVATFFIVALALKAEELSSIKYILNRILKKKTYET